MISLIPLDSTEDEAVWDEEEEAEGPEDATDNGFGAKSELPLESEGFFQNYKSEKGNDQQYLFYVYGI